MVPLVEIGVEVSLGFETTVKLSKTSQTPQKNDKIIVIQKGIKVEKVNRRWQRRSRTRVWSGELSKTEMGRTMILFGQGGVCRFKFLCGFFVVFFCFFFGRHEDMLGKRWANRHGDGCF